MKIVTAAIVIKEGRVLVMRRAPGEKLAGKWEFPGGKLEADETPEYCLQRELNEELMIEGSTGAHICDSIYKYEFGSITLKAYLFHWESGDIRLTVHDQLEWLLPDELLKLDLAPADVPIAEAVKESIKNV